MRGLIVEGVSGSGKSTLLRLLQRRLADEYPSRTKLFLSEHYTERILEDAKARGNLTFEQALSHITDVVATLERMARWKTESTFALSDGNADITVLVERFYGSHVANICVSLGLELSDVNIQQAAEIYRQLGDMGIGVTILTVDPNELPALIADSRARRNQAWDAYLHSIGDAAAILHITQGGKSGSWGSTRRSRSRAKWIFATFTRRPERPTRYPVNSSRVCSMLINCCSPTAGLAVRRVRRISPHR